MCTLGQLAMVVVLRPLSCGHVMQLPLAWKCVVNPHLQLIRIATRSTSRACRHRRRTPGTKMHGKKRNGVVMLRMEMNGATMHGLEHHGLKTKKDDVSQPGDEDAREETEWSGDAYDGNE